MNSTTKTLLEQRLVRGTPVIIADSFARPALRSAEQVVASKGPVKCNKGGRCAGDWCVGLAVFTMDPETLHDDKDMAWRSGTTKVCLTHIKDEDGQLILAPAALTVAKSALERPRGPMPQPSNQLVTWEALANVVANQDWAQLSFMARTLKRENEELKSKMIEIQSKVIESLTAG